MATCVVEPALYAAATTRSDWGALERRVNRASGSPARPGAPKTTPTAPTRRPCELSINEIAERLALPKTTVWYWISDLPLGRTRRRSTGQRKGTTAMQDTWRLKREAAYHKGSRNTTSSSSCRFRGLLAPYIAEGYKRCRKRVSICNSDERIVVLTAGWRCGSL